MLIAHVTKKREEKKLFSMCFKGREGDMLVASVSFTETALDSKRLMDDSPLVKKESCGSITTDNTVITLESSTPSYSDRQIFEQGSLRVDSIVDQQETGETGIQLSKHTDESISYNISSSEACVHQRLYDCSIERQLQGKERREKIARAKIPKASPPKKLISAEAAKVLYERLATKSVATMKVEYNQNVEPKIKIISAKEADDLFKRLHGKHGDAKRVHPTVPNTKSREKFSHYTPAHVTPIRKQQPCRRPKIISEKEAQILIKRLYNQKEPEVKSWNSRSKEAAESKRFSLHFDSYNKSQGNSANKANEAILDSDSKTDKKLEEVLCRDSIENNDA